MNREGNKKLWRACEIIKEFAIVNRSENSLQMVGYASSPRASPDLSILGRIV